MEAQDNSSQEQEALAGDGMEGSGEPAQSMNENEDSQESRGQEAQDPLYVQKRLKQQKRAHEREIRDLHARIGDLQSRVGGQPEQRQAMNQYDGQQNTGGVDEQIHKAVSYALQHKEMQEREAKQAAQVAHVNKQYQELNKHLDSASDKYDDFDDVVRNPDTSDFTPHMRDAALFLPKKGAGSAAEVLYKLGKNPDELSRIAKLHPLDQATEMVRLSHALISGGEAKNAPDTRPLGQIKNNPVTNSRTVTDKTPVSELRKRMKSGWK